MGLYAICNLVLKPEVQRRFVIESADIRIVVIVKII